MSGGLFDDARTGLLRAALAGWTTDTVHDLLGLPGRAALERGDLAGATRALRGRDDAPATLVRLFVLGAPVPAERAAAALAPLPLDAALAAGLVTGAGAAVRAGVDLRPYAQAQPGADPVVPGPGGAPGSPTWWVVSDLGADVRPGPLPADHVLGVGSASLTLAQATPREPVGRALDIGTGSGVQALHLGTHAREVVATDVSARALRFAATTAALSGQAWDLRTGSLLDPVVGERFDLVVANPPFVVSDGGPGWEYRDGGLPGDGISERLVRDLPAHLTEGGSAHLLANWVLPADGDWRGRVEGWLTGSGCDAWVWQREVAEPGEYVTLWLRDAGLVPTDPRWVPRYDAWLDWFAAQGVVAVGMGLVSLWRSERDDPTVVLEDVPQPVAQPIGAHLPDWLLTRRWLARTGDTDLLGAVLRAAPGLVRERADVLGPQGWADGAQRLRQSFAMRWAVDTDDAVAAVVAACDGRTPLTRAVDLLAAALGRPADDVATALIPVVRDLLGRGFLLPPGGGAR